MGTDAAIDIQKYSIVVQWSVEDGEFVATCPEFEGLSGLGATPEEAIGVLREAIEMAAETYSEDGHPLPQPRVAHDYSGQFRLRVPKHLHAALATVAEQEGVSLNTLAVGYLAEAIGRTWSKLFLIDVSFSHEDVAMLIPRVYRNAEPAILAKSLTETHLRKDGEWLVVKCRPYTTSKASALATTKHSTIGPRDRDVASGRHVTHGRIRDQDAYGSDPKPPKDRAGTKGGRGR